MLSAVILAKNEEKVLSAALESVQFCDEIVVIDDNSEDKTSEIARKFGARVITHSLKDFSAQRNFAFENVKGDWVLYVDADEVVTEELAHEIQKKLIGDPSESAFYLKRRDYFWGEELKFGETYTARSKGIVRLVKKGTGSWEGSVHEVWETTDKIGTSNGYLNHFPHQTIIAFLRSINKYSTIRAQELSDMKVAQGAFGIIALPFLKFAYTYFVKLGFLDGPSGFVYSFMMSFHSFLVRSKLYVHQQAKTPLR